MKNLLLKCIVFFTLIVALPSLIQADPAPFGLVINKTTIAELKSQFAVNSIGINKSNGMEAFDIAPENIHFEGLVSARAAFSKDGILRLFQMSLPMTKFDQIFQSLNQKYVLMYKNFRGDSNKEAKFENDNTYVLLFASAENAEMDFVYINKKVLDDTLQIASDNAPTQAMSTDMISQL